MGSKSSVESDWDRLPLQTPSLAHRDDTMQSQTKLLIKLQTFDSYLFHMCVVNSSKAASRPKYCSPLTAVKNSSPLIIGSENLGRIAFQTFSKELQSEANFSFVYYSIMYLCLCLMSCWITVNCVKKTSNACLLEIFYVNHFSGYNFFKEKECVC